ncbi:ankyrin repeat domain-containing protein [Aestuariicoccus sp. MJ-SS9]|uniref:ankyrin repeat domain-containing protein n=1 Tax=Aestuariicoccus sp. MJ-SS9 TaxID=3079855 RepID=UPI0029123F22|nr:ankyrin repeat domain-containing protein [Aestuariicoccus sp. MJ-SS9]MDU8913437.1 ankyrin repeat domain-containing protein [Aestuariicoccus sp. MJ-SS9]
MLNLIIVAISMVSFAFPALSGPLSDAAKAGDAAFVATLLEGGADPNEADKFGTPLHLAAMNGHTEVVRMLADGGADLEASSGILGRPLHVATNRNRADVIAALIEYGAEVDALDKDNRTPLHIAAKNGNEQSAKLLIDAGADVNFIRVGQGSNAYKLGEQTPLHVAIHDKHLEVASLLKDAGATPIPIVFAENVLASADIGRGRELARVYCKTCHAIEAGDPPPAARDHGPPLIGIYGQEVARDTAFEYSQALRDFGGEWTDDRLYSFVYRPMLTVPGTLMGHQLVRKPKEIADITFFLKSLAY